jgi:hypothetical protein
MVLHIGLQALLGGKIRITGLGATQNGNATSFCSYLNISASVKEVECREVVKPNGVRRWL